jgi:hypothetical protein
MRMRMVKNNKEYRRKEMDKVTLALGCNQASPSAEMSFDRSAIRASRDVDTAMIPSIRALVAGSSFRTLRLASRQAGGYLLRRNAGLSGVVIRGLRRLAGMRFTAWQSEYRDSILYIGRTMRKLGSLAL